MVDVFWTRVRVPPAPPHEIKKAYRKISLFLFTGVKWASMRPLKDTLNFNLTTTLLFLHSIIPIFINEVKNRGLDH